MGRGSGVHAASESSIRLDFYYRGQRCREHLKLKPTAANLRYAERLKGEIQNEIARGTFDYARYFPDSPKARILARQPGAAIAVKEALRIWLKGIKPSVQYSTYYDYSKSIENFLIPQFGNDRLTDINRPDIKAWAAGLNVSQKRVNNLLTPLRGALADAVEAEQLNRDPLVRWSPTIAAKGAVEDEIDPFTPDEMQAIFNAATGQMLNLAKVGFWTGVRTSELIALQWLDIDWRHGLLRVRRANVYGRIKPPKTKAGIRDVKLLAPALAALKAQRKHTELQGEWIFHDPRNGAAWVRDQPLRTVWQRLLRRAKVRYRYPYQMRHTYASLMLTAGEDPAWLARQMGHKDWGMIRRVYARWIDDARPDAGGKAEALWAGFDGQKMLTKP